MLYHIFLSYSRKDTNVMYRVRQDFQRAEMRVWTDEGIEPGTSSWQKSIENSIHESGCLVCILSPDSAKSEWVREELNYARTHQKQIFLLLARGDERTSVPFGYSSFQWGDIRNAEAYRKNMMRLLTVLRKRFEGITLEEIPPDITSEPVVRLGNGQTRQLTGYPPIAGIIRILPEPFRFCDISAGEVEIEGGQYYVNPFQIAKYPITNEQYQVFVDAEDGYANSQWWEFSDEARLWRKRYPKAEPLAYEGVKLPRSNVSWYEAIAFCRWLSQKSGHPISLPTEQQWLRSAQGNDKRAYPWGEDFSTARCNTLKSNINKPTPVDQYPGGISPFGVMDLCGNVSEWCLSEWRNYGAKITGSAERVLRGGSWNSSRSFARVITRDYAIPEIRSDSVGFRVCSVPENVELD